VAFFKDADLLIFDAQYTFADACTVKEDWGHSNNMVGVELAQRAGVRRLCLYHQDPGSSDEALEKLLTDTRKFAALLVKNGSLIVDIAYDGMLIRID
jgi:ribonuclease BN (tRNA processing enzyme)